MTQDEMRDAQRWSALMFLHPVDIATAVMGAKDGKEMQAELARRADAFIERAKAAYAKHQSSAAPETSTGEKK